MRIKYLLSLLLVIALALFIFYRCGNHTNIGACDDINADTDTNIVTNDNIETVTDIITDINNGMLESWEGIYSFYEYNPPDQNMSYKVTINDKNGLYAHIIVDGFQTLDRLKAKTW